MPVTELTRVLYKYRFGIMIYNSAITTPSRKSAPTGCRFNPRCQHKMDVCEKSKPKLVDVGDGHKVACFLYSDLTDGDN